MPEPPYRPRPLLRTVVAAPGVRVLHATGRFAGEAGARLLRLVDAQLALARGGAGRLAHVVVDLSGVDGIGTDAVAALNHARYACERRGVGLHLVGGAGHVDGLRVRSALVRFSHYPTVELALSDLRDPG